MVILFPSLWSKPLILVPSVANEPRVNLVLDKCCEEIPCFQSKIWDQILVGDLALWSLEQESCPWPTPAAKLRRPGPAPHQRSTIEPTLFSRYVWGNPEFVSMRELYLSVLSGMGGGKMSSSLSHTNPSTHVTEGRDGLVVIRIGERSLSPAAKTLGRTDPVSCLSNTMESKLLVQV